MLSAGLLVLTALLAGATGTWSPCGFSMLETVGPARAGSRRASAAACAAFTLGALAGGVATFTALSALGSALGGGAALTASAIAAAAALAEARGVRIVPQIRRQVPEAWRRTLPLALAAGLYGVLLGLGFTTFVLTFAVWALAGICVALGDPLLGAAVGLAFGLGRALPIAVLAPLEERGAAARAALLMAERPSVLRALRAADGAALLACAVALALAAPVALGAAGRRVAVRATDPSVAGGDLAWQEPGVGGILRSQGRTGRLPGQYPALGGPYVAYRSGADVVVVRRGLPLPLTVLPLPDAGLMAVSSRWLVYLARGPGGGDRMVARPLAALLSPRVVASARAPSRLGRPALDGDRLVYHRTGPRGSELDLVNLATGRRRALRRAPLVQLVNPSLAAGRLLYVRASFCAQQLRLGRLARGPERVLLQAPAVARRDPGHQRGYPTLGRGPRVCPASTRQSGRTTLWTTALARGAAYVTLLRPGRGGRAASASLLRVRR